MRDLRPIVSALLLAGMVSSAASAQIPRERADPSGPVDEVFWAPNIITLASVANLPKGNINVTIMHVFGLTKSGVTDLFGLDDSANIRIGVDVGITDRLSVGIGRSRFDKLIDGRIKANILRQSKDDSSPLELALKGDIGIRTDRNGFEFKDRLNFLGAVLVARRFSDALSVQLTPMISHFNTVLIENGPGDEIFEEENSLFALGIGIRIVLKPRVAVLLEYIPVLGPRSDRTQNEMAIALNIETGGHVFQLFLKSSQWLTEQHSIARNRDQFFDGDFRFGFNVNRVFALGGN